MNMSLKVVVSALLCLNITFFGFAFAGGSDKLENDFFDGQDIQLELHHSFTGSDDFAKRGVLEVRNLRSLKMVGTQNQLSVDELKKLKDLQENDGYYFLKIKAKTGTVEKTFRTFIPARSLIASGLSDVLTLHISPSSELYAISYSVPKQEISTPLAAGAKNFGKSSFSTSLQVHYAENGPVPDTAPYLEKLEHERIAKERGEDGRDNRSFLAKYWMYIVPIVIIVMLSGASNPEEGGGGGR